MSSDVSRREFLNTALGTAAVLTASRSLRASARPRPNILFILADDLALVCRSEVVNFCRGVGFQPAEFSMNWQASSLPHGKNSQPRSWPQVEGGGGEMQVLFATEFTPVFAGGLPVAQDLSSGRSGSETFLSGCLKRFQAAER